MKKSKEAIKGVQVILTEKLHQEICAYAEKKGWNVSQCIREALKMYLHDKNRKR